MKRIHRFGTKKKPYARLQWKGKRGRLCYQINGIRYCEEGRAYGSVAYNAEFCHTKNNKKIECMLMTSGERFRNYVYIGWFGIEEGQKGRGFGVHVFNRLEDFWRKKLHVRELRLSPADTAAERFWKGRGFEYDYARRREGSMSKFLSPERIKQFERQRCTTRRNLAISKNPGEDVYFSHNCDLK